jgi:TrmH family RNA methyltransferase|tara:strand:+ start:382 stop:1116 length:735 start_codon:yes stop_codon:yes gene_type:complete
MNKIATKSDIKFVKSLKLKKNRVKENKFIVEGLKNVQELLKSKYDVLELYCTETHANLFNNYGCKLISPKELANMGTFNTNNACLAVAQCLKVESDQFLNERQTIILDGIGDPGNLGTIIRAVDWFGFNHLICSENCADFYNPKTLAASMGSFTRVGAVYVDLNDYLNHFEGDLYGLDLEGKPLDTFKNPNKCGFILGNESHGISPAIQPLLKERLTIKKYGSAESLNVAMTANILLYQLRSFV